MKSVISVVRLSILIIFTVAFAANCSETQELSSVKLATTQVSIEDSIEREIATNPLKPPDTASPRATLLSFLDNVNLAYRILMAAHKKNMETPGLFMSDSVKHMEEHAEVILKRGVYCLNLSEVPVSLKENIGIEAMLKLKEILDRIDVPDIHLIPDAEAIAKEKDETTYTRLHRWKVSETDIVIARVEEGPREGEYLFTPQTVSRVNEFYNKVKHLPYKSNIPTSPGFFAFYSSTPGRLLPPKWSQILPDWVNKKFLFQSIWQWGALLVWLLLVLLILSVLYRRLRLSSTEHPLSKLLGRRVIWRLITIGFILMFHFFNKMYLNLTGPVFSGIRTVLVVLFWFLVASTAFIVGRALAEKIIASPKINPKDIQASYIRAIFGVISFITAAVILIFGLARVGVALAPLLTGVGIGGLAIALAARPTLENLIASFTIFADKPFTIGQRIRVMEQDGIVESIGLRTTGIRLFSGHLTSIPNIKMVSSEIENVGRRPYIRRTFSITITYDTPPEKIKRALAILHEILSVPEEGEAKTEGELHPNEAINQPNFPPRVYFNEFNPDSLNIYVSYWYHPPKYWDYLEHAQGINIQIMDRFNAEGIEFAFPTQTLHLAGEIKKPPTIPPEQTFKDK